VAAQQAASPDRAIGAACEGGWACHRVFERGFTAWAARQVSRRPLGSFCYLTNGDFSMVRILSLDDDPIGLGVLLFALRNAGYECIGTTSEQEAMSILRTQPIDLFTQDFVRPGLGGYEFLRWMKSDKSLKSILVLGISATPRDVLAEKLRRAGLDIDRDLDGYIQKPFTVFDLLRAVEVVLKKYGRPVSPQARGIPSERECGEEQEPCETQASVGGSKDSFGWANRLIGALRDKDSLAEIYALFMDELLRLPLWSPEDPHGGRIPWRAAERARRLMQQEFDSPGLYIFGAGEVPLYIGKTKDSLWNRLRGRYLNGERSQCELAARYSDRICEKGIEGFPEEIRKWYRRQYGGWARLEGAVAFARHGIERVWFALIPVTDETIVDLLERRLIPVANEWNRVRGFEGLLNKQYARGEGGDEV